MFPYYIHLFIHMLLHNSNANSRKEPTFYWETFVKSYYTKREYAVNQADELDKSKLLTTH